MLAVSVHPTPLRCIGFGAARTLGDIDRQGRRLDPIGSSSRFAPPPVSTHRPCTPPRSSGALKLNSAGRCRRPWRSRSRGSLPPSRSGHAVADHVRPIELIGLARLEALAAHHHRLLDAGDAAWPRARRQAAGRGPSSAPVAGRRRKHRAPAVTRNGIAQRGRPGSGFCWHCGTGRSVRRGAPPAHAGRVFQSPGS